VAAIGAAEILSRGSMFFNATRPSLLEPIVVVALNLRVGLLRGFGLVTECPPNKAKPELCLQPSSAKESLPSWSFPMGVTVVPRALRLVSHAGERATCRGDGAAVARAA